MKSILGISAFYHDSAACILVDGEIIAAAQEERFTRKKHDPNYPHNAIEFVLKYANLKLSEVDQIVFFTVVTPTSLIMKALGKNLLNLKRDNKKTYWIENSVIKIKMKNQF